MDRALLTVEASRELLESLFAQTSSTLKKRFHPVVGGVLGVLLEVPLLVF